MVNNVQYVKHSCYFVELDNLVLLFDYYDGDLLGLPKDKPIYAFASHFHQDHFSFHLFQALRYFSNVTYILSKDIKRKYSKNYFIKHGVEEKTYDDSIIFIGSDASITIDNLSVKTLKSTDSGVAFLIECEGLTIYHAGDLNWWTWEGETKEEYDAMTAAYQYEISKLKDIHIDLAFLPLDPRQREKAYLGFDYFMNHVDVSCAYAIHCWGNFDFVDHFFAMDVTAKYRDKLRY